MSYGLHSYSSSLMLGTTLFRNQSGIRNKLIAQAGYAMIAVIATAESVAALAACLFSIFISPCSIAPLKRHLCWLESSLFTIPWSVVDFLLNPFVLKLVANESSAHNMYKQCDLLNIPSGAII